MNGEHRLRSENLAFDVDVWYPPLAAHTFASVFLPLTRLEAQAIVAYYNASWRSIPDGMNVAVVERLLTLEARIDEALKQFHDKGAFLRLCGRSPKDGEPTNPELRAQIWTNYQRTLRTIKEQEKEEKPSQEQQEEEDQDDGNLRVVAIARTESWLRVRSGADAMSLLLTSERVFSDMLDWLHFGEPEQLVLREFSNAFDLSTEFRCYIQNGQLQGISQYDTYAKHSFLQVPEKRVAIIHAVISEWRNVRDCVETIDGSYCADFGVDMEAGTAQLIEISPFRNCTGPALFAWQDEAFVVPDRADVHDDNLLTHMGSAFPQDGTVAGQANFRIRSEVIPGISALVEMNWDLRWSKERVDTPKPYRQVYNQVAPGLVDKTMHILKKIQWSDETTHTFRVRHVETKLSLAFQIHGRSAIHGRGDDSPTAIIIDWRVWGPIPAQFNPRRRERSASSRRAVETLGRDAAKYRRVRGHPEGTLFQRSDQCCCRTRMRDNNL